MLCTPGIYYCVTLLPVLTCQRMFSESCYLYCSLLTLLQCCVRMQTAILYKCQVVTISFLLPTSPLHTTPSSGTYQLQSQYCPTADKSCYPGWKTPVLLSFSCLRHYLADFRPFSCRCHTLFFFLFFSSLFIRLLYLFQLSRFFFINLILSCDILTIVRKKLL